MYYNGQSGRPYAYAYNSDVNGDGGTGNDLLYIPNPGEFAFVSGTYDDLINFINAGNCTEAGHDGGQHRGTQHLPRPVDQPAGFPSRSRRADLKG